MCWEHQRALNYGKMKIKNLIDIALGKEKSDLAIKNVNLKGATGYF
jgi:hypothetical protein